MDGIEKTFEEKLDELLEKIKKDKEEFDNLSPEKKDFFKEYHPKFLFIMLSNKHGNKSIIIQHDGTKWIVSGQGSGVKCFGETIKDAVNKYLEIE